MRSVSLGLGPKRTHRKFQSTFDTLMFRIGTRYIK